MRLLFRRQVASDPQEGDLHGIRRRPEPVLARRDVDRAGEGSTFPQIWIGGTHIGGCDDLYALDREGKLDGLLESVKAIS